jgi:hypothetical protein
MIHILILILSWGAIVFSGIGLVVLIGLFIIAYIVEVAKRERK